MHILEILKGLDLQNPEGKVEFSLTDKYDAEITCSETFSVYLLVITDVASGTSCATARFSLYRGDDLEDEQTTFHSSYHVAMPKLTAFDNKLAFTHSSVMLKEERYIQDVCMEFSGFFLDNAQEVDAVFMDKHVTPFLEKVSKHRALLLEKEAETADLMKQYKKITPAEVDAYFDEAVRECHDKGTSAPREFIVFSKHEMKTKTLRMNIVESEAGNKMEWQVMDRDNNWGSISLGRSTKIIERSYSLR